MGSVSYFQSKAGNSCLHCIPSEKPFVTQCILLRVEAVARVNLKSKITFPIENTADMPSQREKCQFSFSLCFVFHETKDLPLQWSKIWEFIFILTKQKCFLPLSYVGEHLFSLSLGFEPMGTLSCSQSKSI